MTHVIRPAIASDAATLAALARETFCDTYAAFNTLQDMNLHIERSYTPEMQLREITNVSMLTMVAENQGQLTGFAQGHFGRPPPCLAALKPPPQRPWEVLRFYVQRDWHGRGIAANLMNHVSAGASAAGADLLWLSVWSQNERAQSFYRRCGFVKVGDTTVTLGHDVQHDFVMCRGLAA